MSRLCYMAGAICLVAGLALRCLACPLAEVLTRRAARRGRLEAWLRRPRQSADVPDDWPAEPVEQPAVIVSARLVDPPRIAR